jgi:hypothetical protein
VATYTKYQDFSEQLHRGVHNFGSHTFKIALTNTSPNVATHAGLADITEISAGNGYSAGGTATTIGISESTGTTTVTATDVTFTASGGTINTFRYAVLYNDTATSPADALVAYWDSGAAQSITVGNSFVVDFGATLFTHS